MLCSPGYCRGIRACFRQWDWQLAARRPLRGGTLRVKLPIYPECPRYSEIAADGRGTTLTGAVANLLSVEPGRIACKQRLVQSQFARARTQSRPKGIATKTIQFWYPVLATDAASGACLGRVDQTITRRRAFSFPDSRLYLHKFKTIAGRYGQGHSPTGSQKVSQARQGGNFCYSTWPPARSVLEGRRDGRKFDPSGTGGFDEGGHG
jgi:hypothetical protein